MSRCYGCQPVARQRCRGTHTARHTLRVGHNTAGEGYGRRSLSYAKICHADATPAVFFFRCFTLFAATSAFAIMILPLDCQALAGAPCLSATRYVVAADYYALPHADAAASHAAA